MYYNIERFQFPSNGKAYLNALAAVQEVVRWYKFQFPSNGKAYLNTNLALFLTSLVINEFQFPSNGKAYLNPKKSCCSSFGYHVSIPFKRESVSEPLKRRRKNVVT